MGKGARNRYNRRVQTLGSQELRSRPAIRNGSLFQRKILDSGMDNLNDHQRLMAVGNVLLAIPIGGCIGLLIGLLVMLVTGQFAAPWTYIANLGLAVAMKISMEWVSTLLMKPWARGQARRAFQRLTGIKIPQGLKPTENERSSNSLLTTVLSCTALATVLSTQELTPDWLTNDVPAIIVIAIAGAFVYMAECLANPYTINAIAKNRHSYQESKLYISRRTDKR